MPDFNISADKSYAVAKRTRCISLDYVEIPKKNDQESGQLILCIKTVGFKVMDEFMLHRCTLICIIPMLQLSSYFFHISIFGF